jgi:hypothetical protein
MRKIIACVGILGFSACASHESSGRATTARADAAATARHTHHDPAEVAVVNEAEPPRDKVFVDEQKLVVDTHHANKVDPVPIAAVPGSTVADQRDRDYANRTPADRRTNASDAEITQRIHKAVVDDDNLTATAKNVKIATEDGRVTLRGNVRDAREKDAVESHARDIAGAGNVKNQLVVN